MDRRDFLVAAAGLPLTHRSLAGGVPVALVTADTESGVVPVELESGRILRSIPTAPGPRSIERVGGAVVVCHTVEGWVTLIDGSTLRKRRLLTDFREPRYTAAHPNGRYAFITDSQRNEIVTFDVVEGRVVGRVAVGGPARHVSISPDGRVLWISLGSKTDTVAIVDVSRPARPRVGHRLRPPFLAHDVGFAPGGRHVWISSGDRGTLAVYDRRTVRCCDGCVRMARPSMWPFEEETPTSPAAWTARCASTRSATAACSGRQTFGRIVTPSLDRGTLAVLDRQGRVLLRDDRLGFTYADTRARRGAARAGLEPGRSAERARPRSLRRDGHKSARPAGI